MALFNYSIREITAKIVYYGPGLGGKTTNLQRIHEGMDAGSRGKLISLATDADRTLFMDFLPLDLGTIGGYRVRFQLYTVPGQVHYNATRRLVLKGVDAIVFVADSQIEMLERNRESFDNMRENLVENNYDLGIIPLVVQFNKQDLPNVATPEEISESLGLRLGEIVSFNTVAIEGKGVFECLKEIVKQTMKKLSLQFQEQPAVTAGKKREKEEPAGEGAVIPPWERETETAAAQTPLLSPAPRPATGEAPQRGEGAQALEAEKPAAVDDMSEVDLEQLLDEEVPTVIPAQKTEEAGARMGPPEPGEVPYREALPAEEGTAAEATAGVLGEEPPAPAAEAVEEEPEAAPRPEGWMPEERTFEPAAPVHVEFSPEEPAAAYGEIVPRDYEEEPEGATPEAMGTPDEVYLEPLRTEEAAEPEEAVASIPPPVPCAEEAPATAVTFPGEAFARAAPPPGVTDLEPLMAEISLIRDKTEKMENSVAEIRKSIEENRQLINKMVDIVLETAFQGGQRTESPAVDRPKKGYFSRLFGGGGQ